MVLKEHKYMQEDIVIVIGASAGGLPMLSEIFNEIPEDFPAAILIVVHIASTSLGLLPKINRSRPAIAPLFRSAPKYIEKK